MTDTNPTTDRRAMLVGAAALGLGGLASAAMAQDTGAGEPVLPADDPLAQAL